MTSGDLTVISLFLALWVHRCQQAEHEAPGLQVSRSGLGLAPGAVGAASGSWGLAVPLLCMLLGCLPETLTFTLEPGQKRRQHSDVPSLLLGAIL